MAAKYLKKNKAPEIDGISPIALKYFNNHLVLFMTSFMFMIQQVSRGWSVP